MAFEKPDEHRNGKNANHQAPSDTASVKNNTNQERILRNAGYLTAAFILQKILSFLYFVYIARIIGPTNLGLYDPAKSLIPILLIIIDFSLSVVLVREIARQPQRVEEFLGSVLGVKIIFALIIVLGMGLFTNLSTYSNLTKAVLYIDGLIVALDTFTLTFFAVFRGLQNMKFEALGMIITQIMTVIVGVSGLLLGHDLRVLFFAVLAGSIFNFIYSFTLLRKKLRIKVRLLWNSAITKSFLKIALPFALYAMLVKVYTYTDRYLLLAVIGQSAEGLYVVAHKFTYALEFIPSAFAASIFPAMSQFYISSKENLAKTFERAMYYLMILAMPISLGIIALADKIIFLLSGTSYHDSILPLRILISGLIVVFLNFPVGSFLNACNRQRINTINMTIAVSVNVVLNFILIKKIGISGAAIAALTSGVLLFLLGLRQVNKVISYNKQLLVSTLLKSGIASAIMAGALVAIKHMVNISIYIKTSSLMKSISVFASLGMYIAMGALIYFLIMFAFKGFTWQDITFLFRKLIKRAR